MPDHFRDAHCVSFYRTIREGVPGDSLQIGYGYNRYPPSAAFLQHLQALVTSLCASGRLTEYSCPADEAERALFATLLNRYLGSTTYSGEHVVFTSGSTEGISVVSAFAAAAGYSALLPLPCYYAFEQSSERWSLSRAGYYDSSGSIFRVGGNDRAHLEVLIIPNGVTGSLFRDPEVDAGSRGFTLIDCVFQSGVFSNTSVRTATADAYAARAADRTAVVLTASKDLALPGVRAGALVSASRELLAFAAADRFERAFSISPLTGQVMSAYVAALLAQSGDSHREIARVFAAFELAHLCPAEELLAAIVDHLRRMAGHTRANLDVVRERGYPLSLDVWEPVAGYSALAHIAGDFRDAATFSRWIHRAGLEHRLKLNPSYLFGGDFAVWQRIYPKGFFVRLNASVGEAELVEALDRLLEACATRELPRLRSRA